MGRYDKQIAVAQGMIAEAEKEISRINVRLAGVSPHVRNEALAYWQTQTQKAEAMAIIAAFEEVERNDS
jgi:hypothetical protein